MKTRKISFLLILIGFVSISCNSTKKQTQQADAQLQEIQVLIQTKQWNQAKNALDSIHTLYPTLIKIREKAVKMGDEIKVAENRDKILKIDSLVIKKERQLDSLQKFFVFEKDNRINTVGMYTHISQLAEKNTYRTLLKANVNEKGELFLTAIYYSNRKLDFNSLQVKTADLQLRETVQGNGANYTHQVFQEEGYIREMVTFNRIAENEICRFISENKHQSIHVIFQGRVAYNHPLSITDKNAIADTYALFNVVKDLVKMRQEKKNSEALLKKLKQ